MNGVSGEVLGRAGSYHYRSKEPIGRCRASHRLPKTLARGFSGVIGYEHAMPHDDITFVTSSSAVQRSSRGGASSYFQPFFHASWYMSADWTGPEVGCCTRAIQKLASASQHPSRRFAEAKA